MKKYPFKLLIFTISGLAGDVLRKVFGRHWGIESVKPTPQRREETQMKEKIVATAIILATAISLAKWLAIELASLYRLIRGLSHNDGSQHSTNDSSGTIETLK
ncbi:MAG TPA: hypothetical protein VME17_14600 [Bryobacteraceae bacterium]|nr:hypothetical protein [Bryobacteraceae bacterium]